MNIQNEFLSQALKAFFLFPFWQMNNVTLSHVAVVGITLSSGVKPETCLWFVVTHVHLLSRSFSDCFKRIKSYKLLKGLDKEGTASAKEMYAEEKGGLQDQVQSALGRKMCPFSSRVLWA